MKGKKSINQRESRQAKRLSRLSLKLGRAEKWPMFAVGAIGLGVAIVLLLLIWQRQEQVGSPLPVSGALTAGQRERLAADTAWDLSWPPLPNAGTPAKPIEEVRAMYAFAARHPEVLQYAPCYCGCESSGHESARDCFVKGLTADGRPQWDAMGFI